MNVYIIYTHMNMLCVKVAVDSVRTEMKWREKLYLRQVS